MARLNVENLSSTDVVIVATSCLLPGAMNPEEFWDICRDGKSQVTEISDARLMKFLYSPERNTAADSVYTKLACEIKSPRLAHLPERFREGSEKYNRLYVYVLYCLEELNKKISFSKSGTVDLVMGNMNPDTDHELMVVELKKKEYLNDLLKIFESPEDKDRIVAAVNEAISKQAEGLVHSPYHFFVSHILYEAQRRLGLTGEALTVDAACASSITALEIAAQRLRLGLCDTAIAGGAESNLGNGTFIVFSKVGALAEKQSLPFDRRSEGLVQSEGAVFFTLRRLADAVRDKNPILGIIRGVSGSSDGRSASLFQPNVDGQMNVYGKVYPRNRKLHYLEAHGTGTQVGDEVESKSISTFFQSQPIPVGSTKALFGHTKGAAGATGVLKALKIIEHRFVPGSAYCESPLMADTGEHPYVNISGVHLPKEPLRIGINSFGFGGTNYHLLLEEWTPGQKFKEDSYTPMAEIALISEENFPIENFKKADFMSQDFPFKLPPKSIEAFDRTQLGALLATWKCLKQLDPIWRLIPGEKINVVSSCSLFLDQAFEIIDRLTYEIIYSVAKTEGLSDFVIRLRNYIDTVIRSRYSPLTEDAATGVLNNVIAGRICNAFDFFGKSYNVDQDLSSAGAALSAIRNDLTLNPDQLYVFVSVDEELSEDGLKTNRNRVVCQLLTTKEFAARNELTVKEFLRIERGSS